jgi:hypothetical protein
MRRRVGGGFLLGGAGGQQKLNEGEALSRLTPPQRPSDVSSTCARSNAPTAINILCWPWSRLWAAWSVAGPVPLLRAGMAPTQLPSRTTHLHSPFAFCSRLFGEAGRRSAMRHTLAGNNWRTKVDDALGYLGRKHLFPDRGPLGVILPAEDDPRDPRPLVDVRFLATKNRATRDTTTLSPPPSLLMSKRT